jgi:hypothetical protein
MGWSTASSFVPSMHGHRRPSDPKDTLAEDKTMDIVVVCVASAAVNGATKIPWRRLGLLPSTLSAGRVLLWLVKQQLQRGWQDENVTRRLLGSNVCVCFLSSWCIFILFLVVYVYVCVCSLVLFVVAFMVQILFNVYVQETFWIGR